MLFPFCCFHGWLILMPHIYFSALHMWTVIKDTRMNYLFLLKDKHAYDLYNLSTHTLTNTTTNKSSAHLYFSLLLVRFVCILLHVTLFVLPLPRTNVSYLPSPPSFPFSSLSSQTFVHFPCSVFPLPFPARFLQDIIPRSKVSCSFVRRPQHCCICLAL